MKVKIISSTGIEWYRNCIGKVFGVKSESRKGGKGKYVVILPKHQRYLMNGYMYGWIDKEHCEVMETPTIKNGKCSRCNGDITFTGNEYEPSLKHGMCSCGISFTININD